MDNVVNVVFADSMKKLAILFYENSKNKLTPDEIKTHISRVGLVIIFGGN